MEENFQVIDNYLCVKLPVEVDHHKVKSISENTDKFILHKNVKNIVFDFEDTRFMDSSGIGLIIGRYKKITCFGGKIYVVHADKQIMRILAISGLHKYIEVMK